MSLRKKYSVYGSCQAPALAKMLNSCPAFSSEWEFVQIDPCYEVSEENIRKFATEVIPNLDLFFYQPVSEDFRGDLFSTVYLRKFLPVGSRIFSFQYMHWEAYHPTINMPYGLPGHPEAYVDALIAGAISKGIDHKGYIGRLEEIGASIYVDRNDIEKWCVSELNSRVSGENDGGRPIDILFTDFIFENWKTSQLLYTMNHPTATLMRHVASECLRKIGYVDKDILFDYLLDPLNISQFPIYPLYRDCFEGDSLNRMGDFQLLYKKKDYLQYFNEQFDWFQRFPLDDVVAFYERVAMARPWLNAALRRAFEA